MPWHTIPIFLSICKCRAEAKRAWDEIDCCVLGLLKLLVRSCWRYESALSDCGSHLIPSHQGHHPSTHARMFSHANLVKFLALARCRLALTPCPNPNPTGARKINDVFVQIRLLSQPHPFHTPLQPPASRTSAPSHSTSALPFTQRMLFSVALYVPQPPWDFSSFCPPFLA